VITELGLDRAKTLYGGPGKSEGEMVAAIKAGVRQFSCESWVDVRRLDGVARAAGQRVDALLRINPAQPPKARMAMTGVPSQFGFEEADILEATVPELRNVDLVGVHVYYGTQIDAETLPATTASALEVGEKVSAKLGFPCRIVDAGGGFPWPYAAAGQGPDFGAARAGYASLIEQSALARSCSLWGESGRFLSAASGTLLATVLDVKASKGRTFIVLDTGINHLGGMSGLGRILRTTITLYAIGSDAEPSESIDVVGPLCSPLDYLGRGVTAPPLRPGDAVAIPNVGAYGLTASLIGFLGHPAPGEVAYRGDRVVAAHRFRTGHQRV
jgi:diaminopimelate decarboxylase